MTKVRGLVTFGIRHVVVIAPSSALTQAESSCPFTKSLPWYCSYQLSYRGPEETMLERDLSVDRTTVSDCVKTPILLIVSPPTSVIHREPAFASAPTTGRK